MHSTKTVYTRVLSDDAQTAVRCRYQHMHYLSIYVLGEADKAVVHVRRRFAPPFMLVLQPFMPWGRIDSKVLVQSDLRHGWFPSLSTAVYVNCAALTCGFVSTLAYGEAGLTFSAANPDMDNVWYRSQPAIQTRQLATLRPQLRVNSTKSESATTLLTCYQMPATNLWHIPAIRAALTE
eukprot:842897-Rhodomonas_salina.3